MPTAQAVPSISVETPLPDPFTVTLDRLRQRTSQKWRFYDEDVLPAWIAEMDVMPAEAVTAAVIRAMEMGDTGYSMSEGYREAMAEFAANRWSWHFDPATSTGVADVMSGIAAVIRSLTRPGDRVAVSPPVYPPFFEVVRTLGRRVVTAPLREDGRLDLDALDATFATGPSIYLLCNPHNPTGVVHTRAELTALADLSARHGVRVISDEIHAPLVFSDATFVPYLSIPGTASAFCVISASKGWNLAGLKGAMVIPGGDGINVVRSWPHLITDGATHLGVIAQTAALRDGRDWLDAVVAAIGQRAQQLSDLLARHIPQVGYRVPEGTFLAWLDFRALGLGDDPATALLEPARVALSSGNWFGTPGNGFARLNLGTSAEVLEAIVLRLAQGIEMLAEHPRD